MLETSTRPAPVTGTTGVLADSRAGAAVDVELFCSPPEFPDGANVQKTSPFLSEDGFSAALGKTSLTLPHRCILCRKSKSRS